MDLSCIVKIQITFQQTKYGVLAQKIPYLQIESKGFFVSIITKLKTTNNL